MFFFSFISNRSSVIPSSRIMQRHVVLFSFSLLFSLLLLCRVDAHGAWLALFSLLLAQYIQERKRYNRNKLWKTERPTQRGRPRSLDRSLSLSLVFPTTVCLNAWCALYYISPQPPLLSCAAQFPLDEKFKSHLIFFIIICVFVIYIEKETVDGQLSW